MKYFEVETKSFWTKKLNHPLKQVLALHEDIAQLWKMHVELMAFFVHPEMVHVCNEYVSQVL